MCKVKHFVNSTGGVLDYHSILKVFSIRLEKVSIPQCHVTTGSSKDESSFLVTEASESSAETHAHEEHFSTLTSTKVGTNDTEFIACT